MLVNSGVFSIWIGSMDVLISTIEQYLSFPSLMSHWGLIFTRVKETQITCTTFKNNRRQTYFETNFLFIFTVFFAT
jgi:hypothetical protein